MKRLIAFITAVLCVVGLFSFTASAEEVSVEELIENELWSLQFNFGGIVDEEYMVSRTMEEFRTMDGHILPWEKTIPADEFEEMLDKFFAVNEDTLKAIKGFSFDEYNPNAFRYDVDENVYICKIGGIPVTGFMHYDYYTCEKVGSTYKAFYNEIKYESLASALPEGVDEFEYAESLGFPESIKYGGKTYYQDENSWAEYYIKTPLYSGKVYTVEVDGDNVRIISYGDYTAEDLPGYETMLNDLFVRELSFLDDYFSYNLAEYALYQMTSILVDKEWDDFSDTIIPAEVLEPELNKHFCLDEETLARFKQYAKYNETEQTYTLNIYGGFGGGISERAYTAFKKKGDIYEVFFNTIMREYLRDEFDDEAEFYQYIEAQGYPESITYKGKTYESIYGEYVCDSGLENTGKKYTVDLNGGIVRIHSISTFTKEEHPDYVPPLEEVFDDGLWLLNGFFEYGTEYIVKILTNELFVWGDDHDNSKPTVVSSKVFEDTLNKFFVATNDMITALRNYEGSLKYDEETDTYTINYFGDFGGFMSPRRYMCYGDNNDGTYDVFYQTINYDYLSPEGYEQAEAEGWPNVFVYNGVEYQNGIDGYYRIESYAHSGYKYRVSINDDYTVRLLSVSEFEESELPGYKLGDIDGDYQRSSSDAIYLLYNVFFGDTRYPLLQSCDFDANGDVETDDAIYLLYNIFFGDTRYPLNVPQTPTQTPGDGWTGNF